MGRNCSDVSCVSDYLVERNIGIANLTAIPENDDWRYGVERNVSLVCSAFVAHSWKVAIGENILPRYQSTEQTPKDNYQMQIFSPNYFNSQNCPGGLHTTEQGTFCQLMGEFWMPLDGYNSVPPYHNMNNRCPSRWPGYFRCPKSNVQCC